MLFFPRNVHTFNLVSNTTVLYARFLDTDISRLTDLNNIHYNWSVNREGRIFELYLITYTMSSFDSVDLYLT